jgi:hypothetical protein
MSFVDDEQFKAAMIAEIKERNTILSLLASNEEVRETQYQGTTFGYPNVRVRVIENVPYGYSGCFHKIQVGIQVNSEEKSSKEADHISGIIGRELHDTCFSQNGVTISLRLTNLIPALRVETQTWRSEILMTAIAS